MEICLFQQKCFSFIFIERSSPSIQMQLFWPKADDIFSGHNLYLFSSSCEICMQVKYQQLALDMKQQTGSKWGKEYIKAVYCHPAYLTSMQSTSCEMLSWMKHKLKSRLLGEISITSDMQMTPAYGRKQRRTNEPLDESERGEWKSLRITQHSENEDHGIWSHHFIENRWGNNGNSDRFYFFGL